MPILWFVGAYTIFLGIVSHTYLPIPPFPGFILPDPPPSVARPDADVGNRRARRREAKLGV
jgi:hypothetical protein